MKLHPLTAPYQALQRGLSVGSTFFFLGLIATSALGAGSPVGTLPLAVAGFLLGAGYAVAYYRRFEYELTDDTFDIVSGVLGRRRREIPLRRVQNVDISQDVVSRALGIATVAIETAGGGETEASLRFVGVAEADRLQRELRQRKAGRRREDRAGAAPGDADGEAVADEAPPGETGAETESERTAPADAAVETAYDDPEETLFELATRELVLLSFASVNLSGLVLSVATFPFLDVLQPAQVARLAGEGTASTSSLAFTLVRFAGFLLLAWVFSAALNFAQYYDFRLSRVGDELQYERGLLQRYSGSIPLDKVQALTIRENPLKRRLGYATVAIETAGYASGEGQGSGSSAAVPLARRERALALARTIEPFGPTDVERPPRRARRRYAARYALVLLGLTGALYAVDALTGDLAVWYLPLAGLLAVPVAAHLKWTHRGHALREDHALTRTGFWRRATKVVPYYRIQTVVHSASVFQRRRDLASVTADTAGASSLRRDDATAHDVDAGVAVDLRETLRGRLHERVHDRAADRRARRLERLAAFGEASAPAESPGEADGTPEDSAGDGGAGVDASDAAGGGSPGEDAVAPESEGAPAEPADRDSPPAGDDDSAGG